MLLTCKINTCFIQGIFEPYMKNAKSISGETAIKLAYFLLALISLCAAIAGLVLPLLPATPFLLMSIWAAARGSSRLHSWIWQQPRFAMLLRQWREQRALDMHTKVTASGMLIISGGILFLSQLSHWILILATLILVSIAVFIFTRPSPINSN